MHPEPPANLGAPLPDTAANIARGTYDPVPGSYTNSYRRGALVRCAWPQATTKTDTPDLIST